MLMCLPRRLRTCSRPVAHPVRVIHVSTSACSWVHIWSLLLLGSAPLVFVCSLQSEGEAERSQGPQGGGKPCLSLELQLAATS